MSTTPISTSQIHEINDMSKTELMDIGEHCAFCGQLDFLPFKCGCKATFCSQHRNPELHNCPVLKLKKSPIAREQIDTSHLPPSQSLFPDRSNFKIQLKTVDDHPVTVKGQLQKDNNSNALQKIKKFFIINKGKKKPVTNATKRIVELSKLKSSAKGDSRVPTTERIYIWVQVIDDESKFDKIIKTPLFISRAWPLGRGLDSIATQLNLKNVNNKTNDQAQKLFLFKEINNNEEGFMKLSTGDRCSVLKDGETVFVVRGTDF